MTEQLYNCSSKVWSDGLKGFKGHNFTELNLFSITDIIAIQISIATWTLFFNYSKLSDLNYQLQRAQCVPMLSAEIVRYQGVCVGRNLGWCSHCSCKGCCRTLVY